MVAPPSGTVGFVFTDIEGSTRLWETAPTEMNAAVERHDELLRGIIERAGGYVFKTVGDAFHATFSDPLDALKVAADIQRAVADEQWPTPRPIRVRIALHVGACEERDGDYFGTPVNRTARIEAITHGGQTVLSHAVHALVADRLPSELSLRDLGLHTLKDLSQAEHVWQVVIGDLPDDLNEFPPLTSLNNVATNLTEQVNSFVGREHDIASIREYFLDTHARLVTIAGPGGVGKTRLAQQTAADMVDDFVDGVWLTELAHLDDPDQVPHLLMRTLGILDDGGDPLTRLVDVSRDRRSMLLILDNCEHVIDSAAKVADQLLRHCPGVMILATSREPLSIDGEHVYRLEPLGTTSTADDALPDAVQLFCERATLRDHRFTLAPGDEAIVRTICQQLDGIPLAIELAAAHLDAMSVAELAARLERHRLVGGRSRSHPGRQQALTALIDWSWDLLTGEQRLVLARTSIFPATFGIEAARAVCRDDSLDAWTVSDIVEDLTAKSLIQSAPNGRRYLLQTIRDYATTALERLSGDQPGAAVTALRRMHRDHYLTIAEAAAEQLLGRLQNEWLERLDIEHDNLKAALVQSVTDRDPEPGLRLAVALWWYWNFRGYAAEGVDALTALSTRSDVDPQSTLRGRALVTLSALLMDRENAAARAYGELALEVGRSQGDDALVVNALSNLAWVDFRNGDFDGALRRADDGLAVARAVGLPHLIARVLNNRACVLNESGDRAAALDSWTEGVELLRASGNAIQASWLLSNLAYCELTANDLEAARAHLTEVLETPSGPYNRANLFALFNLGIVDLLDGDAPAARARFRQTLSEARTIGDAASIVDAVFGLALAALGGDLEAAATLHGCADDTRDGLGIQLEHFEASLRDEGIAQLRAALGDEQFERCYERGKRLSRDDAIALALT